ncbi:hypothetical protein [Ornithinimicrobium murale]|uniref:hypothetical protein n=1 Tax=Ornithinimicrobium murale TaxID=1050153 RepID=UPI000E0D1ADF|nr:hypothetical protein [Ornithinimicrobium murale]
MSYTRWSDTSDVYIYGSDDGFVIHVASRRWDWTDELPVQLPFEPGDPEAVKEWLIQQARISARVGSPEYGAWQAVPAPYGGQSYILDTSGECAQMLTEMAEAGVMVPDGLVDEMAAA